MRAARAAVNAAGAISELQGARTKARTRKARSQAIRIKIISMGDAGVGKSCVIKRYCEEKFVQKYIGTIGVDYGVKAIKLGGYDVRVNLWDLAGGDEYFEVRNEFYKDAQGCVLCYDVNNRGTFNSLNGWIDESMRYGAKNCIVVVAANKTDLGRRVVTEQEGRAWAESNGFLYFETSAESGARVKAMFAAVFHRVLGALPHTPDECVEGAAQLVQSEYAASAAQGLDCKNKVDRIHLRGGGSRGYG
uniref:Uncharacterized protein n=1 Tax=Pyramimonas obovata TaxID=1411642 RepID=A0A7S0RR07_9CHLO|mmetsp:Transcript_39382/g.85704  ORF Transcript_39382/g.85704 Transcript_39382/m.85704 type:complete len:247 (+) Transcript_39382:277-1017(+)|eukprot:CAMPEP_0118930618 /NCGR_PEP_ID=MMETSP1169-20130426/7242_1 /TAXON_ID=36882 /ORGANISM="Pyramimonas obovata, Strain CCMP722" /LENGTH=246 /DNA_ID=CAMNT_0006873001 /DNA_START=276 /DNA_END=1016 /DNA_ORIENTATION=-